MDYRDVGHLSDRRLSMGEENAVAIIGMQRAAAPRMWVSGQRKEVSVPSVMNAVFDNPKLISKTIFRSWFKRLGLKIVVHAYNTRNAWIQLPGDGSVFDARFLEPELGTCWEVLVKPDVMAEVRKVITGRKDAPKGPPMPFKKITKPDEAIVNREADLSGRSQTQAASPGLRGADNPRSWDVVDADKHEALSVGQLANTIEDLVEIDRAIEAGEIQVAMSEGQVAVPEAQQVRRVVVPPEVRGWEEDE